ncbi:glutathione S-transferase theta-4-like isoform X1 [Monodelphis domestica]|uniref:glutathione S-transferase theta-4-like isoform X1 n=1 Tax=Monodelphis domestica TaxID=13616 RepID=UPI0024E26889|nr:glutathione S-transferase theta-4-like isoform X1 [Monodelphis domestica]
MSLELYLDLISPPCRSIYVFAKMNNIRFDYFPVDLLRGDHHSKEFEAINMLKTVPVLKEGDFTLIESVAILLYLTRKYRTSIYWYPPDVQLRGLIDEYMAWQHDSIHLKMQKFLWSKLLIPLITGQEMPKEKQDELLGEVNVNVQLFTDHFLKDKPFIAGNIISLADLLAAMEMMQAVGASYNIFMGKPKLNAWRQRVEDSVGARLFEEAHARLLNIKKWDTSFLDPSVKEKIVAMVKNMAK